MSMNPDLPETLRRADLHLSQGRPEQAAHLYRAILEVQPRQFDALFRLGVVEYQCGRTGDSLRLLALAAQVSPEEIGGLSALGFVQASLDRHTEAVESFNRALAIQPKFVEALYRRGRSLSALGRTRAALNDFEAVLALDPRDVLALFNRALILRRLGRANQALNSLDQALTIKPSFVEARFHRAVALQDLDRQAEAVADYDWVLARAPQLAEALNNRGNALEALDQLDEARLSYERALVTQPDYADALNNRGRVLNALNRSDEALDSFDRALRIRPDDADVLSNRGAVLRILLRPAEALADHDRALSLRPNHGPALNNRGNALYDLARLDEALASYARALSLNPRDVEALNNRGNVLCALERAPEALASYDQALAIAPGHAESSCNRGVLLAELGRHDEAVLAIENAIALAPSRARYYYNLAEARRMTPNDPQIRTMRDMVATELRMPVAEQIDLRFALGKALADIGEHEESFQHLIVGNALKRSRAAYDETATLDGLRRMAAAFSTARIGGGGGLGDPSALPVFIVGMPRSGTTLVEQILASHPQVHAAGETNALAEAVECLGGQALLQSPEQLAALSADALRALGLDYVRRLSAMAPSAARIVNKTTDNFRFIGLILVALPRARIIHTRRDPIDTCLSCFAKRFTGYVPYAFDLAELGRYHHAYQGLMAHWRSAAPQGLLEVDYEAIVTDLEGHARRILAYCGLDWNARCLDFHMTQRQVRTASAVQVRQPIYDSAIGRARPYQAFLGPLLQGLKG